MVANKWLRILCGCAALTLVLGACGTPPQTPATNAEPPQTTTATSITTQTSSAPEEKATVQWYTWVDPGTTKLTNDVADAYNAQNTGIEVVYNPVVNDTYADKMTTMLAGGADVDVVGINGTTWLTTWGAPGALAPLDDLIKNNSFDIEPYGPIYQQSKINDHFYGLPNSQTVWSLYYNRDILDAAGIPYPDEWTWDDYTENLKKLSSGEGINRVYGTYHVNWIPQFTASQQEIYFFDDDIKPLFDSAQMLYDLYITDKTSVPLTEQKTMDLSAFDYFASGKCGLYMNGSWTVSFLQDPERENPNLNWGVTFMPVPADGSVEAKTTCGQQLYMAIANTSTKQQAAFEFLMYACGEPGSMLRAADGGIPAYFTDEVKAVYLEGIEEKSVATLLESRIVGEMPVHPLTGQVQAIYNEECELWMLDEQTREQAEENFLSRRQELLDNNS